jgi:hypothetical protein
MATSTFDREIVITDPASVEMGLTAKPECRFSLLSPYTYEIIRKTMLG